MGGFVRHLLRIKKPNRVLKFKERGDAWMHNIDGRVYNLSSSGGFVNYSGSNAPALKQGLNGNYLEFTAANSDKVDLGASPIASTGNFTLMQYFRTTNTSNYPVSCRSGGAADGYEFRISSGNLNFRLSTASANQETGTVAVNDGQWHLAIGIVDFNEAKFRLIVDNSLISTNTLTGTAIAPTQNLIIGLRGANYWDGDSSYIVLLPRAMAVSEAISYGKSPWKGLVNEMKISNVSMGIGIAQKANVSQVMLNRIAGSYSF